MNARIGEDGRSRASGFTLAELLVTITILGVVSGLGLTFYTTAIDYYGLARSEAQADLVAQAALQSIRDDVSSVLPSSLTGQAIVGTGQHRTDGGADAVLVLPVSVPTFADGRYTAAQVRYHVQRIQGNARLVRTAVPLHQSVPDNIGATVAAGIVAFNVEYLDREGAWHDEWTANESPIAIRVSLTLREADSLRAPAIARSLTMRVPSP